jgi:hypothetical protein
MNIAKREKLRNDKYAKMGQQHREDKQVVTVRQEEHRQKRVEAVENKRQERMEARMEKQLVDKQFQDINIRRGIQVDDKRNAKAKQEMLKQQAERKAQEKQKLEVQRRRQKEKQQDDQQHRKDRIEKQMVDERRQKLDETRHAAISRKQDKLEAKQLHALRDINAAKEEDHRKMLRRREMKEKSRHEHAAFCAAVRKSRSDREQDNLKLELQREEALQQKEGQRNMALVEGQRTWFHTEEERQHEVEQRKLAKATQVQERRREEVQRQREEKAVNVRLEAARQVNIAEREAKRILHNRQLAEGYQMLAEEKATRELQRKERHLDDMKQLKFLAVQNRRTSMDLQSRRELVMVSKDERREEKQREMLQSERADFQQTAQRRKADLLQSALSKEEKAQTKLEKRLREKARQKELAEKRETALQRRERTRDERARLDSMALKEI